MKFIKKNSCRGCTIKCDVHKALISQGADISNFETIQAEYSRHELICKQNAEVTHAIYMVKGTATLFIEGYNNRNIILYILRPHNYIGLLSFFESPQYSYSVKALEECHVCMIDLKVLKTLYAQNHDFLMGLNEAFGKSVKLIMNKIISLNQKQIRGRVAESLLYLTRFYKSTRFTLLLTRKELGEFSSISEENTVRILNEFKREKIISITGKDVEILDQQLLEKINEFG